ncbi:MAG: UbiD family decarboxylase [Candidatus Diapherotrites archaeon CG08_land_8_20_14_0_20_34_12]|nr:MAG: UbiD family decarboxylase [Candidatus Diapherotrites archaeon CG08_land_8_20_14_0_20_34_12]
MSFRDFLSKLDKQKRLLKTNKPISKKLEISSLMRQLEGNPLLFENVKESEFRVAANVFSTKDLIAEYFGVKNEKLIPLLSNALENRSKPREVKKGFCQEIEEKHVDLDKIPMLFHYARDGGNYVTSGVIIAKDNEFGQNVSFHRCMQLDKKRFSVRILPRHLKEFIKRNNGELDVALCVGNSAQVSLAGATSTEIGINELEIANSIKKFDIVKAKTSELLIPADCEFVLEGRIVNELADEGKFVDLTETYDLVRQQPVFEVKKITHRKNAIWHALLPGGLEHKILMGMPREPTIFKEVNKVCKCLDVSITLGGCDWLHAVVKIDKKNANDGIKAGEAAFKGHSSLKHAFIVDKDIDIKDFSNVEWSLATRFQADKNLNVRKGKGSSLDPSADPNTRDTAKAIFDLTIPAEKDRNDFAKVDVKKVGIKKYFKILGK